MFVTAVGGIYPVAETELGCRLYSSTVFPSSLPLDPEMLSSRSVIQPLFESARLSDGIVLEVSMILLLSSLSFLASFFVRLLSLLLQSSLLELLASLPSSEFLLVAACCLSKRNFLAASFLAAEPNVVSLEESLSELLSESLLESDEEDEESKSMTFFDDLLEFEP